MGHETKEQRFVRVAEKRVQNILKGIQSLSQLSNPKIYRWNQNQMGKIWKAIEEELVFAKKRFEDPEKGLFKL